MRFNYVLLWGFILFGGVLRCCDKDDEDLSKSSLVLEVEGLENLGDDYVYEGWIEVDGEMVSVGTFTIDDQGGMSKTMCKMDIEVLEKATSFLVSIEPESGWGDVPAETRSLAGNGSDSEDRLSLGHGSAVRAGVGAVIAKQDLAV